MSTRLHPHSLGTILSIWAHPDDETFLAGGVMAAALGNGQRVVCVTATAGEHGTADPQRYPPSHLAVVRRREAAAAMAVLGVSEHRMLGYEDGSLASVGPEHHRTEMVDLIDEVRPDAILTFGPDGMTYHPDHRAISAWVTGAWAARGRRERLLHAAWSRRHLAQWSERYERWGIFMTDERPVGFADRDLDVDLVLDPALLGRKVEALLAMPSQTAAAIEAMGIDALRADAARECFVSATRSVGSGPGPVGPASR
jgi:LmbE family N-acetylglucosaminyl deacetylase